MTASPPPIPIVAGWLEIQSHAESRSDEDPAYFAASPQTLVTTSQPARFSLGTGSRVLASVFSKCLATNHELILVTCFWARSQSQKDLSALLLKLSEKAMAQCRKIRVRICFSSLSLAQKLFHTSSLDGQLYPPPSWVSMGLPDVQALPGLELAVKSIFLRPFAVMHPKFILVDQQLAFMPSCNVSVCISYFPGSSYLEEFGVSGASLLQTRCFTREQQSTRVPLSTPSHFLVKQD